MVIQIHNDNIEGYDNATISESPFFNKTLNKSHLLNLFRNKKYFSFLKSLGIYIYFRFPIRNHYYVFYFYSKNDYQNFELLFSPGKVIIISHCELSILQDKINTVFNNALDTFIYLYSYNLYSIASRFEYYEKIVSGNLFKKHLIPITKRIFYLMDYFIIKKRFIKNQRLLTKIINSSSYSNFSDAQKNSLNNLMDKNIILLNYLLKFNRQYLLFSPQMQKQVNSFIVSFLILSIFTISIIYFYIFSENGIPLSALLFLFTVFLIGYALNKIQR